MTEPDPAESIPAAASERARAEKLVTKTTGFIRRLCDAAMPRKRTLRNKKTVYWWTNDIACKKKDCLWLRRLAQRARCRVEAQNYLEEYRKARKLIRQDINSSKKACWDKLIDEVDQDPWGAGYKIITRHLGMNGFPVIRDVGTMGRVVNKLFPTNPEEEWSEDEVDESEVP